MKSGPDRLSPSQTLLNAAAVQARVHTLFNFTKAQSGVMTTSGERRTGLMRAKVTDDWSPNGHVRIRRACLYAGADFVADHCVTYGDGQPYPGDWGPGAIDHSYTLVGADPLSGQAVELYVSVGKDGERGYITASTNDLEFWTNQHDPETMARLLNPGSYSQVLGDIHIQANVLQITSYPEEQRLAQALGLPYKD